MNNTQEFELDKKRINTLLNINNILIQQCTILQKTPSQHQQQQELKESFQNYIKRIHSNLTMLATINEKYSNPISIQQKQQFPQIMTPPSNLPEVFELYQLLQNLYPEGVQFYQKKLQQLRQQQQQQQLQQVASPQLVLSRLTSNNGTTNNNNNNNNNNNINYNDEMAQNNLMNNNSGGNNNIMHMGSQNSSMFW